jgi:hypothetical protein
MTRDEILAAFDRIRVWQQGDRRAVHKPLLVLLALVAEIARRILNAHFPESIRQSAMHSRASSLPQLPMYSRASSLPQGRDRARRSSRWRSIAMRSAPAVGRLRIVKVGDELSSHPGPLPAAGRGETPPLSCR